MISFRPANSEANSLLAELVHGQHDPNKLPSDCRRNDDKLSRSFIRQKLRALKPRLPLSMSIKRSEIQMSKISESFSSLQSCGPLKRKTPLAVQFNIEPVVHTYEANPAFDGDIWWLPEELDALRRNSIVEDSVTIKEYLIAYKKSFRELQSFDKVSSKNMAGLVAGLEKGHRGLEMFTALQQVERKNETASVIASVVALHQHHKTLNSETSKLLRAHCTSLTSRSRHWAQALGKADMYAAYCDTKVKHATDTSI